MKFGEFLCRYYNVRDMALSEIENVKPLYNRFAKLKYQLRFAFDLCNDQVLDIAKRSMDDSVKPYDDDVDPEEMKVPLCAALSKGIRVGRHLYTKGDYDPKKNTVVVEVCTLVEQFDKDPFWRMVGSLTFKLCTLTGHREK